MSGSFVNRGMMKIFEQNDTSSKTIKVYWYTGSNMQNRDIRKFVEIIYRNFEEFEPTRELNHNRTEIKRILTSPTSLTLVAVYSNGSNISIVSYLIADLFISNNRRMMHIYYLFTSPAYRDKGVATYLLNQVHEYADVFNCKALSLTYDTFNHKLAKFYFANGFNYDSELMTGQRFDSLIKYI